MASRPDHSARVAAASLAFRVTADIEIKLNAWKQLLAHRRALLLDHFGLKMLGINSLDEARYREHADVEALAIVSFWCEQRGRFCREMRDSLEPHTIVVTYRTNQSAALGDHIREAFDISVRVLDADLRQVTDEAYQTLTAAIERARGD